MDSLKQLTGPSICWGWSRQNRNHYMKPLMPLVALALSFLLFVPNAAYAADTSYEGTFSASFPDQMQSCTAAQNQAERLVREHFRSEVSYGARLSVAGKRCDCSKNSRFSPPLYECIGYATGEIQQAEPFDDSACSDILSRTYAKETLYSTTECRFAL